MNIGQPDIRIDPSMPDDDWTQARVDAEIERIDAEFSPEPRRPAPGLTEYVLGALLYAGIVAVGWWTRRR